jgi:hypothetical protein
MALVRLCYHGLAAAAALFDVVSLQLLLLLLLLHQVVVPDADALRCRGKYTGHRAGSAALQGAQLVNRLQHTQIAAGR